jgi:MFS family permease
MLGFITIMALLVALLIQPLIGQWSDQTNSRWGKRSPYLAAGVIGLSLALGLIIWADNLFLLVIAAMLVSMFSNTTQAAWQALLPDYVAEEQRGRAAGIKSIMEIIGAVLGIGAVTLILVRGYLWGPPLITALLFVVILPVTLYSLRRSGEPIPVERPTQAPHNFFSGLITSLKHAPPAFLWWMLNRFFFWSAAIAIRTFLLNYMEDVLGLSVAEAQSLSSQLFIILGIGVFLLALPAGAVADRFGRRPLLITAGLTASCGATIFIFGRDLPLLFGAGALIAGGAGIFASASWALATDLVPKNQGALYLALANGATVLGSIGGRLGGPLIDGLNRLFGTVTAGYLVVFAIAALFFAASSLVVLKINPASPEVSPLQAWEPERAL